MPVNVPISDRAILSRYLLGKISAQEADEVEDHFAGDDAYFACYEEVERALVCDYAAGVLGPSEVNLFEKNYLVTPERRHEVSVIKALLRVRAAELNQPVRSAPFKLVGFAVATSAVLAAILFVFFWPQNQLSKKSVGIAQHHQPAIAPIPAAPALGQPKQRKSALPAPSQKQGSAAGVNSNQRETTSPQEPLIAEAEPPAAASSHGLTTSSAPRQVEPANDHPPTAGIQDIAAIRSKLLDKYSLTTPTISLDGISTAGSVLVLKKTNLLMVPVTEADLVQNTYKNEQIIHNALTGRLWSFLPSALPNRNVTGGNTRTFIWGEKVRVTDISIANHAVVFALLTQDWSNIWYKGKLLFPLPKDGAVSAEQVEQMVDEVFEVRPPMDIPPTQITKSKQPEPVVPPAPVQPTTIAVGQTPDEVVAVLGKPLKVIKLSSGRELYFFKDKRVTILDGKVANVDGETASDAKAPGTNVHSSASSAHPVSKVPAAKKPPTPGAAVKHKPT